MARETGLEPATSGVTGRRSNQLSYSPARAGRPKGPSDGRGWSNKAGRRSSQLEIGKSLSFPGAFARACLPGFKASGQPADSGAIRLLRECESGLD